MIPLFLTALRLNLTTAEWLRITTAPKTPPVFTLAWTPWCGYCRSLLPAWRKLSFELDSDPNVILASLNCTQEGSLCKTFGIRGYPSFFESFCGTMRRPRLPDRGYNSFANEANRLRKSGRGEFVARRAPAHPRYPSFVFRVREDDHSSRAIAKKAAEQSPLLLDSRFFFEFGNATSPHLNVLLAKNQ